MSHRSVPRSGGPHPGPHSVVLPGGAGHILAGITADGPSGSEPLALLTFTPPAGPEGTGGAPATVVDGFAPLPDPHVAALDALPVLGGWHASVDLAGRFAVAGPADGGWRGTVGATPQGWHAAIVRRGALALLWLAPAAALGVRVPASVFAEFDRGLTGAG